MPCTAFQVSASIPIPVATCIQFSTHFVLNSALRALLSEARGAISDGLRLWEAVRDPGIVREKAGQSSGTIRICFGYISDMFRVDFGECRWSGGFRVDFGCTSDGFRAVFGVFVKSSGNDRAYFGHISGTFRAHFGYISGKTYGHGTG